MHSVQLREYVMSVLKLNLTAVMCSLLYVVLYMFMVFVQCTVRVHRLWWTWSAAQGCCCCYCWWYV